MAIDPMAGMEQMDPEYLRRLQMMQEAEQAQLGLAGTGLGSQAIEAEGEVAPVEGPTPDIPFRYTQQELSPGAHATAGQWDRNPRARSAFGLPMSQAQAAMPIMYQSQLPMVERQVATGKIDQYRGLEGFKDITDPNSLRGRAAIAELSGFEGKSTPTLMFDMAKIGEGMGFSESKVQRMLGYSPNRNAVYRGVGTRDSEFRGPRGLISDMERQKLLSEGLTTSRGRDGEELTQFTPSQFQRVYQGPKRGSEAFGKNFGDEEQFFMGLAQLSGKPGGKAGRMEGGPNFRGTEGFDYGKQKGLDLDLDDPRHMAEVANIGQRYTSGRGFTIQGDEKKGLFTQQRDIDRRFREAGRVSGSIWEDKGKLMQIGVMAAMAAMTGGALGPVLAGALAGPLGLAGAGGIGVASGLGGSILTGASMGLTGGAMGGLMKSMGTGFQGGLGGTLKNIGMGAGIGGLSGGVLGGIGHGASLAMGGQGFQGLGAGGFSQGDYKMRLIFRLCHSSPLTMVVRLVLAVLAVI
jgi:hypothetical protein